MKFENLFLWASISTLWIKKAKFKNFMWIFKFLIIDILLWSSTIKSTSKCNVNVLNADTRRFIFELDF